MRSFKAAPEVLSAWMDERKLTAAELSRQTGIDAGILRKIMTGRETAVSTRNLMTLARYFGLSMHRASDTDKCIFGRKSQSVQGLTYDENEAVLQQLLRKMIDVMLGPAAEAVPTQELHALELCPQGAQLLAAFFRRLLRRLCGLRFLCLIFDQTGFSFLAARQSCSASGAAVVSTSCAAECQRTDDLCSFYYTPCTE